MSGGRHKRGRWAGAEPARLRAQVDQQFCRRFDLSRPQDGWRLPGPAEMFPEQDWQVAELQTMKHELNAVKSMLNDKDITTWHEHTCATNRAGLVVPTVRRQIRPEMGTQAWCKFYELLSLGSVLPPACAAGDQRLFSLHLCEAPGAFVTALNHHCVLNGIREWDWLATTLNPYYEGNPLSRMISDDRFILHTLPRWHFGADDTGDLMTADNADRLLELAASRASLVTADGSVDCQGQPAEQERMVSTLHQCEVFCALRALRPGGNFVIKMFTFFESSSVCLLYLLSCCFAEVSVVKPSCSKAGNSEVYVVCRAMASDALSGEHAALWRRRYGVEDDGRPLLGRGSVPDQFVAQLVQCARYFKTLQEAEISRNLQLFGSEDEAAWEEVDAVREAVAAEFLRRCRLLPIDKTLRLSHPVDPRLFTWFQVENKSGTGSYEQRTGPRSAREQLAAVARQLAALPPPPPVAELTWRPAPPAADFRAAGSRTEGLPPARLRACKFCSLQLLKLHARAAAAVTRRLLADPEPADAEPPPEDERGLPVVRLALPGRAEPWLCDAATVAALRAVAAQLTPRGALEVRGLFLFHRLNVSLLLLVAAQFEEVALLPPAEGRPRPRLQLRAARDPPALVALLDAVLDMLTPHTLALLPVAELCLRPAVERLVAYNDRLLRLITADLLQRAEAEDGLQELDGTEADALERKGPEAENQERDGTEAGLVERNGTYIDPREQNGSEADLVEGNGIEADLADRDGTDANLVERKETD